MRSRNGQRRIKEKIHPTAGIHQPGSPAKMYLKLAADQQESLTAQEVTRIRRVLAIGAALALALFVPLGLAKTSVDIARASDSGGWHGDNWGGDNHGNGNNNNPGNDNWGGQHNHGQASQASAGQPPSNGSTPGKPSGGNNKGNASQASAGQPPSNGSTPGKPSGGNNKGNASQASAGQPPSNGSTPGKPSGGNN